MDFLQPFPNIEVDHCTFLAKNGVSGAAHQRRWQCSACITCFVLVVVFVKTYCWITTYSRFLYLILDGHLIHLYTAMICVVKVFFSADKSALTMSFYDIVDVTNVVIWLTVKWRSNNHLVPTGYLCENKGCLPDRIFFFS